MMRMSFADIAIDCRAEFLRSDFSLQIYVSDLARCVDTRVCPAGTVDDDVLAPQSEKAPESTHLAPSATRPASANHESLCRRIEL